MSMSMTPSEALQRAIEHREIFFDEMVGLMRQIMRGEVSPVLTAAILTGLRVKKETVGEIAAAATVLREFARPVAVAERQHMVDIVGTGGDGAHTFNTVSYTHLDVYKRQAWRCSIARCPVASSCTPIAAASTARMSIGIFSLRTI